MTATITKISHQYGTASVYVETDETFTGQSDTSGTVWTVSPEVYSIDDQFDPTDSAWTRYGTAVTVQGNPVTKSGGKAKRTVRLMVPSSQVPDSVWAELTGMRPDITR